MSSRMATRSPRLGRRRASRSRPGRCWPGWFGRRVRAPMRLPPVRAAAGGGLRGLVRPGGGGARGSPAGAGGGGGAARAAPISLRLRARAGGFLLKSPAGLREMAPPQAEPLFQIVVDNEIELEAQIP